MTKTPFGTHSLPLSLASKLVAMATMASVTVAVALMSHLGMVRCHRSSHFTTGNVYICRGKASKGASNSPMSTRI